MLYCCAIKRNSVAWSSKYKQEINFSRPSKYYAKKLKFYITFFYTLVLYWRQINEGGSIYA